MGLTGQNVCSFWKCLSFPETRRDSVHDLRRVSVVARLARKLFKGTAIQEWWITNQLYRQYVRFCSRKLPGDDNFVTVHFRGFDFDIERGDITILPTLITGEYEKQELDALLELISVGSTFLDVGANIGLFTVLGSQAVGLQGHVVAFEPSPQTREVLERNLIRTSGQGGLVQVVPSALADFIGRENWESTAYQGTAHLSINRIDKTVIDSKDAVTVTTLDEFTNEHGLDLSGGAIKIDVEGFEPSVIIGGRSVIQRSHPVMLIEVCGNSSRGVGISWDSAIQILAQTYGSIRIFGPLRKKLYDAEIGDCLTKLVADGRLHNVLIS
jgi:FkbM family methyltransferase